MGGEKQEKGAVFVRLDPLGGFFDPFVGEVLVAEAGGVAAGVEADAADVVAKGVSAGEEGIAGGCAGGGGAVAVGEV